MSPHLSAPHSLSAKDLVAHLKTHPDLGLSESERQTRFDQFGANVMPRAEQDGPLQILIRQFRNPIVYVLLASSALAFSLGKGVDALVVLGVVVINSLIGFIQEFRAGKALEALSAMVPERAMILTGGQSREVDGARLVPGDIVLFKSGDKVPADVRLIEVKNLRIEEAALTGESIAIEKSTEPVREKVTLGDRTSMAFSGTLITYGTGKGVVTGTGGNTELGKISNLLGSTTQIDTPLTQSLARLGKVLTFTITFIAIILFLVGWWRNFPLADAMLAAITLAVAAIPEGLPAIVTITLAIGVRRMASRKAVIRKLPAVETLGSASIICSDKTGTLTRNEMTVQGLWTKKGITRLTGTGYTPIGEFLTDGVRQYKIDEETLELLKCGVLCNDSQVIEQSGVYLIQGDPTEGALLVAFQKAGGKIDELLRCHPRLDSQPFESEHQYMATLNEGANEDNLLYIKGAPEVIFAKCKDTFSVNEARRTMEKFASEGMRVLALGKKITREPLLTPELLKNEFELLGLQAMIDPPREEVIQAIRECHEAGITVKMITGDHRETAKAIAKQIGIDNGQAAYTGDELAATRDEDLSKLALQSNVFARVTPEQKLRLVKAIQSSGAICSMTGDGVNDAPALKQANIGVAMGITGTSVSKEAADLILTDDNFASIKAAVEEGRRIYDNLVKSLAFVLPTNLGEALIILIAVLFFPMVAGEILMPILPAQILWINLVATVALALPLAFEAPEADIMKRPPRKPTEPILNVFVIWRTVLVALIMTAGAIGLFLYEYYGEIAKGIAHETALREAQTMAVTTVIFFQIFYLFNCRSLTGSVWSIGLFSNKTVYVGIFTLLALQVAFVELPFMNILFQSAPLPFDSWMKSALAGTIVIPIVAIEKWLRKKKLPAPLIQPPTEKLNFRAVTSQQSKIMTARFDG